MQTITSTDGTSIAYERHGEGPPLVLLHGSSGTRHSWEAVVPHLAEEFEVIVPDRRGRAASGDGEEYALSREVADLRAVVDDIEGDVTVFGHSFGGLVALAAAPDLDADRFVLYEPAVLVGEYRDDDLAARMQARLDNGDREGAMKLFYQEGGGIPASEQLPIWPEEVPFDLTETVIRENEAVESYELPASPHIDCPTLLLTGERGPAHLRAAVDELADRLPRTTLVEFERVGHMATQSAPEAVADAVRSFCLDDATRP